MDVKQLIIESISTDSQNPTTMKTLQKITGLPRRVLTDIIRELREDYPICTTKVAPGGYWISSGHDLLMFTRTLTKEAHTLIETVENLTKHLIASGIIDED